MNSITTNTMKSRTVLDCKNKINAYSEHGKIRIVWVPAHSGVVGNERANALAIKARELHSVSLENAKPFGATRKELKTWAKCVHTKLWNSEIVGKPLKSCGAILTRIRLKPF